MTDNTYRPDMKAVEELGYDPITGHSWGMILSEEGKMLQAAKRYEEALEKFREAYEKDLCYITLAQIGQCLLEMGRQKEAVIPLAAATTLGANCRPPFDLAVALHATDRMGDALDALITCLERYPTYGPARRMLKQPDMQNQIDGMREDFETGSFGRWHPLVRLQALGMLDKL